MLRATHTALLSFVLVVAGCGGDDSGDDDVTPDPIDAGTTPPTPVTAVFTPPAPGAGADWGTIPYPSDLFLDGDGQLTLTSLPTGQNADPMAVEMLTETLHQLDGAGVNSQVFFPVDGDVDPATLAGNVVLVDLDAPATPLPVELVYRPEIGAVQCAPVLGSVLDENRQYAAYMTAGVLSTDGVPVVASGAFAEAIDLSQTPQDAAIAAAQNNLRPLIEALDATVVADLAVATVFRTQHATEDMLDMRNAIAATPPTLTADPFQIFGPDTAELDVVFGGPAAADKLPGQDDAAPRSQPHSNVAVVIHGFLNMPSFVNEQPFTAGFMERDGDGVPIVKGEHSVKFTLMLPTGHASYADLPLILWIHGIDRSRADMVLNADAVLSRGYAYLAIDLLYHGDRMAAPSDERINALEETQAGVDGFGDRVTLIPAANFFHLLGSGGIPAYHPRAMMENLRQSAIDLVALTTFADLGDFTAINAALAGRGLPNDLSFQGDRVGILTESFGAMQSIIALAIEPRLTIALLASPANSFPNPVLLHSPNFSTNFSNIILGPYDVQSRTVLGDPTKDARYEPIAMLWNSALERGDPIPYARHMLSGELRGGTGANVLLTQTWQDEWVPNIAVEHLVGVLGVPIVQLGRELAIPGTQFRYVTELDEVSGPVEGNVSGGARTAASSLWYPAAHALTRKLGDYYEYEPTFPPFARLGETYFFQNPIEAVHRYWGDFFDQYYFGADESPAVTDPFAL